MSDYFANKFISPYLLTFLLCFWIALLLFGVYFWEYHEPGSLEGFFRYVSTIVLMIVITYREIQQGKKRIHDKKLLSVTHCSSQIDSSSLLLSI